MCDVTLCVIVIVLRLLQQIGVRSLCSRPISSNKQCIHVICFAVWVSTIYSALVFDKATVPCFFELHTIQVPSMM